MFNKENSFWSNIKPKTGFILGIIAGILIMFVIGFFILLGLYLSDSDYSFNNNNPSVVNSNSGNNNPPAAIRGIQKDDNIRGNKNAKIVLIEYSDFQCPYCTRAHSTLQQVVEEYGDDVAWVYRHFPLDSIHPYARKTAEGSECAADQDMFWEFADAVFADNSILNQGVDGIKQIASSIGLNMNKFNSCLDSGKYTDKVNTDYQEGVANGVTGTPATFINGQLVKGAVPFETFKQIIDSF
ncbi:MAG: DsbA family protein [Candidatus Komeilibacteria bacterium]